MVTQTKMFMFILITHTVSNYVHQNSEHIPCYAHIISQTGQQLKITFKKHKVREQRNQHINFTTRSQLCPTAAFQIEAAKILHVSVATRNEHINFITGSQLCLTAALQIQNAELLYVSLSTMTVKKNQKMT